MGSLQMLTDAWKKEYYYFEVVECLRKAVIIGLGVMLPPGSVASSVRSSTWSSPSIVP